MENSEPRAADVVKTEEMGDGLLPKAIDWYGRTVIPATEQTPVEVPFEDLMVGNRLHLYPEVQGHDYFRVNLSKDRLVFQAGGFIGLIPINERVAIDVRPRVPIGNLERILSVAKHKPVPLAGHLRRYAPHRDSIPALMDLLAEALLDSLHQIEAQGVHRAYTNLNGDTSFPRGRILMGETIRRHESQSAHHRVTATWFEVSVDTAPNRCLKYALWYLAQRYRSVKQSVGSTRQIVSGLNRAYHLFHGAELDRTKSFLKDPLVSDPDNLPSTRAYYKRALYLALAIIQDSGVMLTGHGTDIEMASLLIDMSAAFEAYLRSILQSKLADLLPSVSVLDGNKKEEAGGGRRKLFDEESPHNTDATPDIVLRRNEAIESSYEDRYPLLLDAKYKVTGSLLDRNDVNQAIAYATSYRAPRVVLVHPCSAVPAPEHGLLPIGQIGKMALYQYAINLSASDLDTEETLFAESMRRLALPT